MLEKGCETHCGRVLVCDRALFSKRQEQLLTFKHIVHPLTGEDGGVGGRGGVNTLSGTDAASIL